MNTHQRFQGGELAGGFAGGFAGSGSGALPDTLPTMDETEFHAELKKRNLTVQKACVLIYNHTDVVIDRRDVRKTLHTNGRFSARETAMWRLLFNLLEVERRHGAA